jgi:hypothetical protein
MRLTITHLSGRRFVSGLLGCLILTCATMVSADYTELPDITFDRAYDQALLAPDGEHFAVTIPIKGKAGLVIYNIERMQAVAAFNVEANQAILKFWWANEERVVVNLGVKGSSAQYPILLGELFALNIDNTKKFAVAGLAAGDTANYEFLDAFEPNQKQIRVVRSDIKNKYLELTRPAAYTLDIYKRAKRGTGTKLKDRRLENRHSSPYPDGGFVVDNEGELRLAYQVDDAGYLRISRRDYKSEEWIELPNLPVSMAVLPEGNDGPIIGFDADNEGFFYLGKSSYGTTGLFHYDIQAAKGNTLYVHELNEVGRENLILASDGEIVGIHQAEGTIFFAEHPEVARLKSIVNEFKGRRVEVVNYSRKGKLVLVDVHDEGIEGGLYLYDATRNSLSILMQSGHNVAAAR